MGGSGGERVARGGLSVVPAYAGTHTPRPID
jgi:hypothetical protein